MKEKSHTSSQLVQRKGLSKIEYHAKLKKKQTITQETRNRGDLSETDKRHSWEAHSHPTQGWKTENFLL